MQYEIINSADKHKTKKIREKKHWYGKFVAVK